MKHLKIFLMLGLFMCFQPIDANAFFVLEEGTIKLTCEAGGEGGWFDKPYNNLSGRLTDGKKGLDGVVIEFYEPAKGKKGDYQDDNGEWWDLVGEAKTDSNGDYEFDTGGDATKGRTFFLKCDYIEGSGTA